MKPATDQLMYRSQEVLLTTPTPGAGTRRQALLIRAQRTCRGLEPGMYTLTVTDDNGCPATLMFTITEPDSLTVSTGSLTDVSCFGGSDGAVSVSVSGGSPPYSYLWNTGDVTPGLSNLMAGAYQVTVTDANACPGSTLMFTISEPDSLTISTGSLTDVSCFGGNDGALSVSVSGGTSTYSYLWNTGDVTPGLSNLTAGTYQVNGDRCCGMYPVVCLEHYPTWCSTCCYRWSNGH